MRAAFPGTGPAVYKLDRDEFARRLEAIRKAWLPGRELFLTFDDGGVSAYAPVAGISRNMPGGGHFFVTTDWIGQPGFLDDRQIRELHSRSHGFGNHSCSHREHMAREPWQRLLGGMERGHGAPCDYCGPSGRDRIRAGRIQLVPRGRGSGRSRN